MNRSHAVGIPLMGMLLGVAACSSAGENAGSTRAGNGSTNAATVNFMLDSMAQYGLSAGPDGRVTYGRMVEGKLQIFVADSNGANARQLTDGVWDAAPLWSPDGKWIAFNREVNGFDVLVVPADSGAARPLGATAGTEQLIGWLPDNSGVLISRAAEQDELWVALLDGTTRRLVDAPGSVTGAVSPDGQWVAYAQLLNGHRTLRIRSLRSNVDKALTTEGFETLEPRTAFWSPDSKRVVYVSTRSGTQDIWSVEVETGVTRQLTRDVRDDFSPTYAPTGGRIAFLSTRGGQRDVWVVADTGGEPERVTDDRDTELTVGWTRDGTALLIYGNSAQSHAYRVGLDGQPPVRLVDEQSEERNVRLSRDGSRIVYMALDGSEADVRTALVAGGASTLVAGGPADDFSPAFSPDAQQVVFVSTRSGNPDLWVAPTGGGDARRLLDWPSQETVPGWSPDGQWIAFLSTRNTRLGLWIVRPDGTGARQLSTSIVPGPSSEIFVWSDDGTRIAFPVSSPGGFSTVRVLTIATGEVREVGREQYVPNSFWPGDSLLAVTYLDGGMSRLELRRIADGSLKQPLSPTTGKVYEGTVTPSPDGQWALFAQFTFKGNDYPIAVRNLAGTETRVLSRLRGNTAFARWHPDGKTIVFENTGDHPIMYRKVLAKGAGR